MLAEEATKDAFNLLGSTMAFSGFWIGFGELERAIQSFVRKNPACAKDDIEGEIKRIRAKFQGCGDMEQITEAMNKK